MIVKSIPCYKVLSHIFTVQWKDQMKEYHVLLRIPELNHYVDQFYIPNTLKMIWQIIISNLFYSGKSKPESD